MGCRCNGLVVSELAETLEMLPRIDDLLDLAWLPRPRDGGAPRDGAPTALAALFPPHKIAALLSMGFREVRGSGERSATDRAKEIFGNFQAPRRNALRRNPSRPFFGARIQMSRFAKTYWALG